jgi:hypothetical protein
MSDPTSFDYILHERAGSYIFILIDWLIGG